MNRSRSTEGVSISNSKFHQTIRYKCVFNKLEIFFQLLTDGHPIVLKMAMGIALFFTMESIAKATPASASYVPATYQINDGTLQLGQSGGKPIYNATLYPSTHTALTFYPSSNANNWSNASAFLIDVQAHADYPLTFVIKIVDASGYECVGYTSLVPNQVKAIALPFQLISPTSYSFYASPMLVQYPYSYTQQVTGNYTSTGTWMAPSKVQSITLQVQSSQTVAVTFGQPQIVTGGVISNVYTNIVDTFGQSTQSTWPEKVSSVSDMQAKDAAETQQLRQWTANRSDVDAFGGINSMPIPNQSKFFRTAKVNGRWWFVTPAGHAFFQLGIDGIDLQDSYVTTTHREYMFENLAQQCALFPDQLTPLNAQTGISYFNFLGANLEKKYGSTVDQTNQLPAYLSQFKARASWRLQAWRFNTVGWASNKNFFWKPTLPFVFGLKIKQYYHGTTVAGDTAHFGAMPDVFDPAFNTAVNSMVQSIPTYLVNQNYLIGYFIDNENPWGNSSSGSTYGQYYALSVNTLALNYSSSPSKRELVNELIKKYGSYQNLASAWGIQLSSWNQLEQPFRGLPTQANQAILTDLSTFLTNFATRYFQTVVTALKAYDPNHLVLGHRFSHGEKPWEVVSACLRSCDAVGINNYAYSLDASTKAFVDSLGKPALISEFHFGSSDRGPFWAGIEDAGSEQYRGVAYTNYVNSVAADPNIIACDWYQYVDQPTAGEYPDLENGHIGFISVADVAYQDFATAVRQTNLNIPFIHAGQIK